MVGFSGPCLCVLQVPAPISAGNFESSSLVCIIGDDFPSVVVQKAEWDWINEGTDAKPKWGYVSWKVGAKLVMKIDTRASSTDGTATESSVNSLGTPGQGSSSVRAAGSGRLAGDSSNVAGNSSQLAGNHRNLAGKSKNLAGNSSKHAGADRPAVAPSTAGLTAVTPLRDMIVWIGYLKSWRHVGSATISCIGGCECTSAFVDGMHEEGNTQQYMARLFATQHQHCLVEVKVRLLTTCSIEMEYTANTGVREHFLKSNLEAACVTL